MTQDRMDKTLDAALGLWARTETHDDAAVARLLAHADALAAGAVAQAPTPKAGGRWLPWAAGGGALAASVAVALLFTAPGSVPADTPATAPNVTMAAAPAAAPSTSEQSFALLYTPTSDEEQYL